MAPDTSSSAVASRMTLATPSEREIVLTRVFDAPRRLVFEAYSRPEHLRRWWGPRRLTLETCEMDFRPGGAWRFVERDGSQQFGFRGVYREIVPPERLVYTFEFEGMPGHVSLETVTFTERDGRTTLTSHVLFDSVADRDGMLRSGMEEGAAESMDRLEELLQERLTPTSDREILVTRILDAPRALAWEAWTDPKHLIHWWGPRGFTNTFQEIDVRPGGVWRFIMHGPDGRDYPNKIVFEELVAPERLVYSHGGEDEPVQFRVTVTFVERGGRTQVTARMVFPSAAERERVIAEYGALEGAHQHMDRMVEHVAQASPAGRRAGS